MCYFIEEEGRIFKALFPYEPYFFIKVEENDFRSTCSSLQKMFENQISSVDYVSKVDLNQPNHLSGLQTKYIKLNFRKERDLLDVKKTFNSVISRNQESILKKDDDYYRFDEMKTKDLLD